MRASDRYEAACIGLSFSCPDQARYRFQNKRGRKKRRDQMWREYCFEWARLAAEMNAEMKRSGL